jgi:predicted adenylyl cyclase CyaB
MARNIEIKVRIASVETLLPRARAVARSEPELIEQDDIFFKVPRGRLKLRQCADGTAELIHYHRPDTGEAKASDYVRMAVADPTALREALERACGLAGRVRKRRWLLLAGGGDFSTRIHLDRVEALGDFLELEVMLSEGQSDAAGAAEAERLLRSLGLQEAARVAGAYLDLLDGIAAAAA